MAAKTFEQVLDEVRGKPILVANRGIPARRICRAIRERFAAVPVMTATDIDKAAPAASSAQELLLLGSDPRAYLDLDLIIAKAKQRGIIAIHPGWGFASEDERFPQKCEEAGITFIGSKADSMNLLGNKVQVRKIAKRLGIPVVPGSEGAVDVPAARKVVDEITLPIMLKAEGGGGGRGIFLVREKSELEDAFFKASAMAQASFGNPRLYVEKYLEQVRHIEIQVIADQHGNVFAFDERDCSVQRNHQKLVEITPSPWAGITPELRERLKEYSRMLVMTTGPIEGDEVFHTIDQIRDIAYQYYHEVYVVGDSTSDYDLSKSFTQDNLMVSIMTAVFVAIILLFTFTNYSIPLILVVTIQTSIWINFSIPAVTGTGMFFLSYLIVSSIQMGATIDYAIVITSRYTAYRKENVDKRTAIIKTLNESFPTIITSGSIMTSAGFVIGQITSNPVIASLGTTLGTGTLTSIILVMLILPQLLYVFDGVINKTYRKRRINIGGGETQTNGGAE